MAGMPGLRQLFLQVLELAEGNKQFKVIDKAIGKQGFKVVTLLRLSPLLPLALSNYFYGLTSVDLPSYVGASWLGMLPGTIAYVTAGVVGAYQLGTGLGLRGNCSVTAGEQCHMKVTAGARTRQESCTCPSVGCSYMYVTPVGVQVARLTSPATVSPKSRAAMAGVPAGPDRGPACLTHLLCMAPSGPRPLHLVLHGAPACCLG